MRKRENNKQGEEVRMQKKKPRGDMETEDQEIDIRKIMKDIEFLGILYFYFFFVYHAFAVFV